ncbi:ImmA/IrrE family metallo-endopeptidase [Staphylococcus simulans]|uniref:ImmA/IrrE family metallo-endopeptidase n=1 Tax=Staphylococcus simulans TaxID=1286 RepID=UPI00399A535D
MNIGKQLVRLNQLHGYNYSTLAAHTNISEYQLRQCEKNNAPFNFNLILTLSRFFKVRTSYLTDDNKVYSKSHTVQRGHVSLSNYDLRTHAQQFYQSVFIANFVEFQLKFVKSPLKLILGTLYEIEQLYDQDSTPIEFVRSAAEKAHALLMKEPSNLRLLFMLERAGVCICESNINNEANPFSFWSEKGMPYIVLTHNNDSAVQSMFDVAHELGHLLLHKHIQFDLLTHEEYQALEREANTFALSFLLPEQAFREDMKKIAHLSNPDDYLPLKQKWYVSIKVMGMRAYELGLLTPEQYNIFCHAIQDKHYDNVEPLDDTLTRRHPLKINAHLEYMFVRELITPQKFLDTLKVEPEFLTQLANINQSLFDKFTKKEPKEILQYDFIDTTNEH